MSSASATETTALATIGAIETTATHAKRVQVRSRHSFRLYNDVCFQLANAYATNFDINHIFYIFRNL